VWPRSFATNSPLSTLQIPDPDLSVITTSGESRFVRVEGDRVTLVGVPSQLMVGTTIDLPKSNRTVEAGRGDVPAVGAKSG
jgi:hypothetical protein